MKTITILIAANIYNALQQVKAKKDVRYYLNGIHIDLERGRIEATNGHRLLSYKYENVDTIHTAKYILNSSMKAPAKCATVKIEIDISDHADFSKDIKITFIDAKANEITSHYPEMINDATFPSCDRIFESITDKNLSERHTIAFNPLYLADVAKTLKRGPKGFTVIECKFYGTDKISVNFGVDDLDFVLMTARL